ncbi:MAG: S1 RNA-binding domain-containing protein [Planctomycetota bacterium]
MTVDLDAIAQRGRCEVSSLRLALPLIEQGYSPPFLARYRRDELGGIDESSLWTLTRAVRQEQQLASTRESLLTAWQATPLADRSIEKAINNAGSRRLLDRLRRRIKQESTETPGWLTRLAVRVLNPESGDGSDLNAIAEPIRTEFATGDDTAPDALSDEKVDTAIAKRLCGDPRLIGTAVRWLSRHAKIKIDDVRDPHTGEDEPAVVDAEPTTANSKAIAPTTTQGDQNSPDTATEDAAKGASIDAAAKETTGVSEDSSTDASDSPTSPSSTSESASLIAPDATTPSDGPTVEVVTETTPVATEETNPGDATNSAVETSPADDANSADVSTAPSPTSTQAQNPKTKNASGKKKNKKISPRQRRRRWLVGTLKPLAGKKFAASKLSSFQIVMLGRALRSQVATCAFDYDPAKLVAELQKTAANMNRGLSDRLTAIVLKHESAIRDAAESAWWEELQEQASAKLVTIAAEHLHQQLNRGGVDAKIVMSIDAVGPRTAATTIVAADGRILHCEDIPCQLSAAMRTMAVTKMGELIHQYGVDLIVISNGPARRACMIATGELIKQSSDGSIRWTLADRSGADAYAGGPAGDSEMRSTPRRFRAAAWLAFATLQPSQALVKVDPLKLRLGSFQRELSDDAVLAALDDVLVSGASRGGVDVNSAATTWLERLPGVTAEIAAAMDSRRRETLFASRQDLSGSVAWTSAVDSRQALPFLRVFESEETLDGTLIHPDDYPLAKKLASALDIELPPSCPPGYSLPDHSEPVPQSTEIVEPEPPPKPVVENLSEPSAADAAPFATEVAAESVVSESIAEPQPSSNESDASDSEAEDTAANESQSNSGDSPSATENDSIANEGVNTDNDVTTESGSPPTSDVTASSEAASEPSLPEPEVSDPDSQSSTPDAATPIAETAATENGTPEIKLPEPIRRPRPEQAKIDKLVKEWQVGRSRGGQLVDWLCDPFGESSATEAPPAVMTHMPTLSQLKEGDQVIGVVVGVMPFGVFVELSPETSGLIHVSKIADGFVEDLHEAVQVGDVVTAYVTGIDNKRRRVALSVLSPEREAERRSQRGGRGGPPNRNSTGRGRSNQSQRGKNERGTRGGGSPSGQPRQGTSRGGNETKSASGGGRRFDKRGGGGRSGGPRRSDSRGGGRGSRGRKPEVYEVVGKDTESKPLTDAMQSGDEPLRSFGDLMQLFNQEKGGKAKTQASQAAPTEIPSEPGGDTPVASSTSTEPTPPEPAEPSASPVGHSDPSNASPSPEATAASLTPPPPKGNRVSESTSEANKLASEDAS